MKTMHKWLWFGGLLGAFSAGVLLMALWQPLGSRQSATLPTVAQLPSLAATAIPSALPTLTPQVVYVIVTATPSPPPPTLPPTLTPTATATLPPASSPTASPSATLPSSVSLPTLPSYSPTPNLPAVVLLTTAEIPPTTLPMTIAPLIVENPYEPIPTYATVPPGNEEFVQAAFHYVYVQRPIRYLSVNAAEIQIGFVLNMQNPQWDTQTGLVQLTCHLWRVGFTQPRYSFSAYEEVWLNENETEYRERAYVNILTSQIPQINCAQPETVSLPSIAETFRADF